MQTKKQIPSRTIEMLIGLVGLLCIVSALFLYSINEKERLSNTRDQQLQPELDEAMTIYAENCSVCHGISGEGIGTTPALSNPDLKESDPDMLYKIIARGLYDTSMPPWNKEDGGPLSDYQVNLMVSLIQNGGWEKVGNRVINLRMAPAVPFVTNPDPQVMELVKSLPQGDILAKGPATAAPRRQLYVRGLPSPKMKWCTPCR